MMHNLEHMRWVLALTVELLPPLPSSGVFAAPPADPRFQSNALLSSLMRSRLLMSAAPQRQPPGMSMRLAKAARLFLFIKKLRGR
jgi:hypothetical protein